MSMPAPVVVTPRSVTFADATRMLSACEGQTAQALLRRLETAQQSDRTLLFSTGYTGEYPSREQMRTHFLEQRFSKTRAADRMDRVHFSVAHVAKVSGVTVTEHATQLYEQLSAWLDVDAVARSAVAQYANTSWEAALGPDYVCPTADAILDTVAFGETRTGLTWRLRAESEVAAAKAAASLFHQGGIAELVGLILGEEQSARGWIEMEEKVKAMFAFADCKNRGELTYPSADEGGASWKAGLTSIEHHTRPLRAAKGHDYERQKELYSKAVNAVKFFAQTALAQTLRGMSSGRPEGQDLTRESLADSETVDKTGWIVSVVST